MVCRFHYCRLRRQDIKELLVGEARLLILVAAHQMILSPTAIRVLRMLVMASLFHLEGCGVAANVRD